MNALMTLLAQGTPAAAVETPLYVVPSAGAARIQGLTVCNRSAVAGSFRFSISLKGAATAAQDYLYYDLPIPGNDTFMATLDADLEAQDVVRALSSSGNLTFILYGGKR